ncbi:hypothetical protein CEUSTIGMA_g9267.t1 [Chlamydomonas eustigma]|uniref:proton-translocating NAD(P)(+) transhydrogenase n=1 Tax=Chlamydomonas eustigma TaxID=1157962 RepID=A0A250XG04_9CHLO|nr:hypothetical protein CEUSTIGMA_g9267.t1 [Chlamydomonas eustigma]|eukprot:GAX81839.1 hypothetical protein CEUSTIGMA_g9267.t1 [Chlamydomonas eustigma]
MIIRSRKQLHNYQTVHHLQLSQHCFVVAFSAKTTTRYGALQVVRYKSDPRPYPSLTIGVPREVCDGEKRVAVSPQSVKQLISEGVGAVVVESHAGEGAGWSDAEYVAAGANIVPSHDQALKQDIIFKVRPPTLEEVSHLHPSGSHLISYIQLAQNPQLLDALSQRKATVIGLDCLQRTISRAQAFDTLTSMASVAGYRAVVEAVHEYKGFMSGQITAAGKVPPAKVLIIGGGVAGLAAAVTAKGLGAIVRLFDTRSSVADQAASVGAEFLQVEGVKEEGETKSGYSKEMSKEFIEAEMRLFHQQCREVNLIITTAMIPGKPAPKLLTKEMVDDMKPGSVIVDLAAESGGNSEYTVKGERYVTDKGVVVLGYTDLPSRLAAQASTLFSSNVVKLFLSMGPFTGHKQHFYIDDKDEAVRSTLVLEDGELKWPPPPPALPLAPAAAAGAVPSSNGAPPSSPHIAADKVVADNHTTLTHMTAAAATPAEMQSQRPATAMSSASSGHQTDKAEVSRRSKALGSNLGLGAGAAGLLALGAASPSAAFSSMLTKFGLASICGYQAVWGVTPALHSPLMSVTNAVSGLTAIGGMVLAGGGLVPETPSQWLAATAMTASAINIGGGFTITQRMLDMFRRPADPPAYSHFYAIPAAVMILTVTAGSLMTSGSSNGGLDSDTTMGPATMLISSDGLIQAAYLAASVACLSAIGCLSNQKTASTGNTLGLLGVSTGIAAAWASLHAPIPVYAQVVTCLGVGGLLGRQLASKINITDLPQMVAAFHSLVGFAAAATAISSVIAGHEVLGGGATGHEVDMVHQVTAYLGDVIGAITLTGSVVAF